jgi:single-strand DNA-binding protein
MSINKVIIAGRLGADPDVRRFDNGGMVANFRIAVDNRFRDKSGELKEQTYWLDVAVVGSGAEFVEKYIGKGRMVLIDGSLRVREWTDKEGGKHSVTEIVTTQVEPLDKPKEQQGDKWTDRPMRKHGNAAAARETMAKMRAEAAELEEKETDLPF